MPDHVQALRDLGLAVHLVTVDSEPWGHDPRFTTVTQLERDRPAEDFIETAIEVAKRASASAVVTFIEPDIVIAETANASINPTRARPDAAILCRNKDLQRRFLADNDLPTVRFAGVSGPLDAQAPEDIVRDLAFPVIVKPTRAAASDLVELVDDNDKLMTTLQRIHALMQSGRNFYYAGEDEPWALIEQFLPGEEVTLDGVVVGGQFHLGGIHNKMRSDGPRFAEDLYTLPFDAPQREPQLIEVAQRLVERLDVNCALVNIELRQDAGGDFKIVEFSIRVSGGHVYRHIRDVYSIDLVRIYARAATGDDPRDISDQELPRSQPRMAVCAKVIYGRGRVARNSVGDAGHSPLVRAYYPCAAPGTTVVAGDGGFDFVGLLSVWVPYDPGSHPKAVHRTAYALAEQLDYEVI